MSTDHAEHCTLGLFILSDLVKQCFQLKDEQTEFHGKYITCPGSLRQVGGFIEDGTVGLALNNTHVWGKRSACLERKRWVKEEGDGLVRARP